MSFIYELHCKMCNEVLDYKADMDNDFDIIVDVEPCPECIKEAVSLEREKHDSQS